VRLLVRFLRISILAGVGVACGVLLLVLTSRALTSPVRVRSGHAPVQLDQLSLRSLVYDRNGKVMATLHATENRSPVSLAQVPPDVVNAVLDVEDRRFYQHGGIDVRSLLRAVLTDVNTGAVREGGSTVTQQLVKNSLLTPQRSVNRKLREAILAVRLEDTMSKRQILERYLNTVYLGNGAYGLQAAAETYFGTEVGHLSTVQAALLAGIIRNPQGNDPLRHPEAARQRRDVALDEMVANGHLSQADADRLKLEPLPVKVVRPAAPDDYFVEEVKQRLLDDPRLGDTATARYNAVFRGGLEITTTFDPDMQQRAQAAVRDQLPNTNGQFTAALVAVEPSSGAVRAMIGGTDFATAKYNLATSRGGSGRQPGSSFKPFVLLAALEEGHSIYDSIDGTSPCTVNVRGFPPYSPKNVEGEANGPVSLLNATAHSVNCAYVRLGAAVGLDRIVDMAVRLGIPRSKVTPLPSMSLGTEEVSPLDMASAYATIAADGVRHEPRFIDKVVDRNHKVVFEGGDKGRQVVAPQLAREAIVAMRAVVQYGTGTRAALSDHDVAGKTGTSENYENAWFVGFTPQLVASVWMGAPAGNVPMRDVGGIRVFGGTYPAAIWHQFMAGALDGVPAVSFSAPNLDELPAPQRVTLVPVARVPSPTFVPSPPSTSFRPPSTQPAPTTTAGTSPSTTVTSPPTTSPRSTSTTRPRPTTTSRPPPPNNNNFNN
jgi:penicillin-binding protein 1A